MFLIFYKKNWQYTDSSNEVPFKSLHDVLQSIQLDYEQVKVIDVFPVCPGNHIGITCNYRCKEFKGTALPDGKGGFVKPFFLGVNSDDVYQPTFI